MIEEKKKLELLSHTIKAKGRTPHRKCDPLKISYTSAFCGLENNPSQSEYSQ